MSETYGFTGWPFASKHEGSEHPEWEEYPCAICSKTVLAPRRGFGGPLRACVPCIEDLGKGLDKQETPF